MDDREREHRIAYGKWVREQRLQAGMTQHELGERVGLTRSSVANVESGKQGRVSTYRAEAIAHALTAEGQPPPPERGKVEPGAGRPTWSVDLVIAAPGSPEGLTLARLRALVELATRAGIPDGTPARVVDPDGNSAGLEFRTGGSR